MSNYTSATCPGLLSTFHSTLDNIVKERFNDTFRIMDEDNHKKDKTLHSTSHHVTRSYFHESDSNQLTMGLIGCLPDNVQQAIKSFSIRPGKQHITFAFPFMEDTIKSFCDWSNTAEVGGDPEKPRYISSGLFFDQGLEIVQGFQTYVTLVPYVNKGNFPVVLLTLYQRDTTEGICRHFQSLMRILSKKRLQTGLWKISTLVVNLSPKLREAVLNVCAETVADFQSDGTCHSFQEKPTEELIMHVKQKLLRPYFASYRDLLRRNIQEVLRQLTTTDPAYFLSVLELLQGHGCSLIDFRKVDMMFKSPGIEPVIKEFWKVWGHEQISRQVFPVTVTPVSLTKPLYNTIPRMIGSLRSGAEGPVNINSFPHIPIKEGLQSVIKCLKAQDISQTRIQSEPADTKTRSCSCSVCKIPPVTLRPSSRLRMYGELAVKNGQSGSQHGSAFHLPNHHGPPSSDVRENLARHSFRFSSAAFPYSPFSSQSNRMRELMAIRNHTSTKSVEFPYRVQTGGVPGSLAEPQTGATSNTSSLVQPVPHYFSLGLKPYRPMMYSYSVVNKTDYSVTTGPYQNGFG
ncbi:uncharacterized protein LOC143246366 [Tachypleus tridentatus]|uniref:uncharacterized protein LOC143246366 n=1 Tax=Tachypleus tridentatus TaxID=6853 RepID=UPI003FD534AE